jgi:germination protein M
VTVRTAIVVATSAFVAAALAIVILVRLPRTASPTERAQEQTASTTPAAPSRTIKARLFYVSDDGTRLVGVEREVPFGEGADQAREIVSAQIATPAGPLVSAVPAGTSLRAVFITDGGDAYVDLSREIVSTHTGGTLDELLTVYTIVNAVTMNLPAIRSVQLLVDGKEVSTLAGHVDLRQPLQKNAGLVQ